MHTPGPIPTGRSRRAFTLVEMLFSVAVIILLIGLLIVGLRAAASISRKAAEQQTVASLVFGVEQFRLTFGFVPPLVQDNKPGYPDFKSGADQRAGPISNLHPGDPGNKEYDPVAYLSTTDVAIRFGREERYLRGRDPMNESDLLFSKEDYRFSTYSLAYYLVGALGVEPGDDPSNPKRPPIDGQFGAGFQTPRVDGTFGKAGGIDANGRWVANGKKYEPFFDTSKGTQGVVEINPQEGRLELRDRRGVPYRYYVWRHGRQYLGPAAPAEVREPADLNVPRLVSPRDDVKTAVEPQMRNAEYAIVAAGANGVFGDYWSDAGKGTETPQAIKEGLGVSQGVGDDRAARMAREDNIVGVGK